MRKECQETEKKMCNMVHPFDEDETLTQSSASLWTGQCFIFFQGVVLQVGIRESTHQYAPRSDVRPHLLRGLAGILAFTDLCLFP